MAARWQGERGGQLGEGQSRGESRGTGSWDGHMWGNFDHRGHMVCLLLGGDRNSGGTRGRGEQEPQDLRAATDPCPGASWGGRGVGPLAIRPWVWRS